MKDKNVKYYLEYCKSPILAIIISADSVSSCRTGEGQRRCLNYFFFIFKYLFVYFWLHWVFAAVNGLCPVVSLLIAVAALAVEHGLQGAWAQ